VSIDSIVVKFVGEFDLTEEVTVLIINTIDELIAPYLMGKIGEVLDFIDLDMNFMEEESKNITAATGSRDLEAVTTALIEVSGKLDLEGSEEEVLEWSSQRVTDVIMEFFTGVELEKLYKTLADKNLVLHKIEMHDGNTDSIVTEEGTNTQSTGEGESENGDGGGSNKNMTAVIAAATCGGFVCLVLAVAMFVNGRRQRRKFRSVQSIADTETLNLRSGKDDLPDCNASTSESHVSFPDVLGVEEPDKDISDHRVLSASHAPFSSIPEDDVDIDAELDAILDDEYSFKAVHKKKKKKRRSTTREEHDLEKALSWAKRTRNKAPQPYGSRDEQKS